MKGIRNMNSKKRTQRILSAMLTVLFLSQQTMLTSAIASDITGINQDHGTFNIDPTSLIPGTSDMA